MKKILCLLSILFILNSVFAQETEFKEYSYSEFFQMIEEEEGETFYFENARIQFDQSADTLFQVVLKHDYNLIEEPGSIMKPLIINKKIKLDNVHFNRSIGYGNELQIWGSLTNIHFMKSVTLNQTESIAFVNCIFENNLDLVTNRLGSPSSSINIWIFDSEFRSKVSVNQTLRNSNKVNNGQIQIHNNTFDNQLRNYRDIHIISISGESLGGASLKNNTFSGYDLVKFEFNQTENLIFSNNKSEGTPFEITISGKRENQDVEIIDNIIDSPIIIKMDGMETHYTIPFMQFNKGLFSSTSYAEYFAPILNSVDFFDFFPIAFSDSVFDIYANNYMYEDKKAYDREMALMGSFYSFYKAKFAREDANAVFIKMKDMETKKLIQTYQKTPSFKTLFSIRINQFLKIFSAYGTEPARAIIFSLYIILIFASIYLFFPNSWDVHGKNRIIHRFTFFLKYMNRKQGIHEVYLEDKQDEFMEYAEYKSLIETSSNKVPGFFRVTALPLYRWAISGIKITASLLSCVDVLKGTWEETPAKDRWWKYILLIGAFLIAVLYDIIIKILNALMLSVNTFTTLGFGEIPIKGLPRYLAIIQGFIGWFMLTIFSVSLISQLLD